MFAHMNGKKYVFLTVFAVVAFLPFIPYLMTSGSAIVQCIFCDIVAGSVPQTRIEIETDEFVIFKDIKPSSTYHYLAVSKRHIESVKVLTKEDDALVAHMETGLKGFLTSLNIDINDALFGFHLPPFITVKHLHMHGIAPRSEMTWVSRLMFRPGSAWFKTVDDARKMLQEKS